MFAGSLRLGQFIIIKVQGVFTGVVALPLPEVTDQSNKAPDRHFSSHKSKWMDDDVCTH